MTIYRRPDPIPRPRQQGRKTELFKSEPREQGDDLRQYVAKRLFVAIDRGDFAEGSLLPGERELTQMLGVSRSALREAVNGLASKGLVEPRRKRGTLVQSRSGWNMLDRSFISWSRDGRTGLVSQELWEALLPSLPAAAGMAADRRTGLRLIGAADMIQKDLADFQYLNSFMVELVSAAGNRFLATLITFAWENLVAEDPQFLRRAIGSRADHLRAVARAAHAGDVAGAEQAMYKFIGAARGVRASGAAAKTKSALI